MKHRIYFALDLASNGVAQSVRHLFSFPTILDIQRDSTQFLSSSAALFIAIPTSESLMLSIRERNLFPALAAHIFCSNVKLSTDELDLGR